MADRLEALLDRFPVSARMFHAGTLCGIHHPAAEARTGQRHFIRRGVVEVVHDGPPALHIDAPSLLLYPRPLAHRFITDPDTGADLTCANLRFEGGAANPIAATLPAFVCLPQLMETGQAQVGLLGGLAHPRLRLALVAMHERPAQAWSLDTLAAEAGMSRSVFANTFRDTLGCTPGAYLQQWRVALAQRALRQGRSLKRVADE